MTYRATESSSSQTPDERQAEARKILFDMGLAAYVDLMAEKERDFVSRLANDLEIRSSVAVSVKQLWWLRDLKEKYL